MFLNQYSGTMVIVTYTADIFSNSGSNLTPNESSIVVAVIQLFGVYVSTICVEKFGRKVCLRVKKVLALILMNLFQILMTISCTGAAIFYCVLATYSYLKASDVDVAGFESVPIVSLSLVIFIASLGIISLPFVIAVELLPNKVSSVAEGRETSDNRFPHRYAVLHAPSA
jgi:Sugar (and other) transporter